MCRYYIKKIFDVINIRSCLITKILFVNTMLYKRMIVEENIILPASYLIYMLHIKFN